MRTSVPAFATAIAVISAANLALAAPLSGLVHGPSFYNESGAVVEPAALEAAAAGSAEDLPPLPPLSVDSGGALALANALREQLVGEANTMFRSTPGWSCIRAGTGGAGDVEVDPSLQPFISVPADGIRAYDGATISPLGDAAAWRVGLSLTVAGKFTKTRQAATKSAEGRTVYDPGLSGSGPLIDIRDALLSALREELQELVTTSGVKPCQPKAKIKGTITGRAEGSRVDDQVEAEGPIALDENGAFQASIPFSISGTWTLGAPLNCSGQGMSQGTFDVAGSYDGGEALVFSRFGFNQTGGTNVTNCPGMQTVQAVNEEMAEGAGLRIALADGGSGSTRATLPGGDVRELNFELSYDGEDAAAATS